MRLDPVVQSLFEGCEEEAGLGVGSIVASSLLDQLQLLQLFIGVLNEAVEHRTHELLCVVEGTDLLWLLFNDSAFGVQFFLDFLVDLVDDEGEVAYEVDEQHQADCERNHEDQVIAVVRVASSRKVGINKGNLSKHDAEKVELRPVLVHGLAEERLFEGGNEEEERQNTDEAVDERERAHADNHATDQA